MAIGLELVAQVSIVEILAINIAKAKICFNAKNKAVRLNIVA